MNKALIFDITKLSYVDGPGARTTVFFKGCNLACKWCHNPEGISPKAEILFYKDKCTRCGNCERVCPSPDACIFCGRCEKYCPNRAKKLCGKEYSAEELFFEISKDKRFYDASGGGVTFSGGECMLHPEFLSRVASLAKGAGIHTAIDTAGNVPYENFLEVMPYCDLFLYDVKCASEKLHKAGTGASNERIIENLKRLAKESEVVIRIPVIGGFNDDKEEMKKIRELVSGVGAKKIELLPYHGMAKEKYAASGRKFTEFNAIAPERLKELKRYFGIA